VKVGRKGPAARAAALGVLLVLAAGSTAAAALPGSGARARAHELSVEAQALDTKAHHALLEVYALDARLSAAQQRVATLETRSAALRARQAALTQQIGAARATLAVSRRQLSDHLRSLYETGSPDPLAVLLGASSLQDAVGKLDTLTRIADQRRRVVAVTAWAQSRLARARLALAARRREIDASLGAALAAQQQLASVRSSRLAYVGSLRASQRLEQAQVRTLLATARASELKSQRLQTEAQPAAAQSPPSVATQPAQIDRTITVVATGYSLPGHTATGLSVGWGVVAVDPSVIPLGTKLTVPGYGDAVAADVGGSVRGAFVDLWFPTQAQARAWGRRTITITLH
jgi:3D (Asp-Asp-Asp) domain-containing protein